MSPQQKNARGWMWPTHVPDVPAVLIATQIGFDLVTWIDPRTDRPYWRLWRDGEISPAHVLSQGAADAAAQKYFGHPMKLHDGCLLYKRKAGK